MKSIDWKKVRSQGIPFQVRGNSKGRYFETLEGIEIEATTTGRKWLRENVTRFSDQIEKKLEIKRPGNYSTYIAREISKAGENHDFHFPISLKVKGLENESKWLALNEREYKKLLDLFN